MDWYLGNDGGDLVVPKDQEYFDRLPSPDSWSQWGNGGFGNMGWQNNFESEKITSLPEEKSHQRMSCGRGNFEMSQHERDQCSFGSSNLGVSSQDSLQRSCDPCGRPEYNFDDLMEDDTMDDTFLSSLLQDDYPSAAGHNHNPFGHPTKSQCCTMMATDSESTSMMLEYQSMSSDTDVTGNSKGFRTLPFSTSSVKVLETTDMLPSDSMRCGDEDSSVEESVLLGLEAVMSQLSDKTRLCFRDSLYRLAQRSNQQFSAEAQVEGLPLERSPMLETTDEQTRSTRTSTTESATNTIDRAVANLMFNKANENLQEHLPDMSTKFEHQGQTFAPSCNYGSNHTESSVLSKSARLPTQDSEVPIFRQQNPHNPSSSLPSCGAEGLF